MCSCEAGKLKAIKTVTDENVLIVFHNLHVLCSIHMFVLNACIFLCGDIYKSPTQILYQFLILLNSFMVYFIMSTPIIYANYF